jgi:flagellar hook protein FlgE
MSIPAISNGLSGIYNGMGNLKQDAQKIASASAKGGEDTADLAKSLVDLNTDRRQVEASVKVVQAVDETIGTLLNVKV